MTDLMRKQKARYLIELNVRAKALSFNCRDTWIKLEALKHKGK